MRTRLTGADRYMLEALGALLSMGLSMSPEDLEMARPADMNCSKHLSIINDIWNYEKELLALQKAHEERGVLCTGVATFANEADVSVDAAKRVLYRLCRKWGCVTPSWCARFWPRGICPSCSSTSGA